MLRTLYVSLFAIPVYALEPSEIIVLTNKNVPASKELADHYLKTRSIPTENVVELDLPKEEDISRKDYDLKLVAPLREALSKRKDKVKCLLTMYGVPLRVGGVAPSATEQEELKKLEPQVKEAEVLVKASE